MPKRKPSTLEVLKHEVLSHLQKHPGGMTMDSLKRKFIQGPLDLEENRTPIWRLVSALVSLQYQRSVAKEGYRGMQYYYPRAVV